MSSSLEDHDVVLTINNDVSICTTTNQDILNVLWQSLRFRDRNYFHNRRYKQKLWDGYIDFFNKTSGKFLTGLLPEVILVIKHHNLKISYNDKRTKTKFAVESIDKDYLKFKNPSLELHDYQVDFVNQIIKHKRGVIYAPTSAGKSFIMVSIIKSLPPNTPILVLQNRVGLASQNYEEIKGWDIPNVGCLWGKEVHPNIITVASVQSISKIENILPKIKVVIVDEIHDMMSSGPKSVYKKLKGADIRVALSATPFKFGEKDKVQKYGVKGFFGPVLKTNSVESGILTTKELQNRGILSTSKGYFIPVRSPDLPHDIYIDAVTRGIAENNEFHDMVKEIAIRQKGRTLILVDRIAHGDTLHKMIPDSLWVQGKDDSATRKFVIKELQQSKENLIAIATQQIFNTGINVFLHQLINAAGGQADHQIIQRMGRGLRISSDKEDLKYFDFIFDINPYLLEHSKKRIKILIDQGHIIKEVTLDEALIV